MASWPKSTSWATTADSLAPRYSNVAILRVHELDAAEAQDAPFHRDRDYGHDEDQGGVAVSLQKGHQKPETQEKHDLYVQGH